MKSGILVVGNFTPASNRLSAELAERLRRSGWTVFTASSRPGRLERAVHMVAETWRRRRRYAVAEVDVYSGPAFVWAEAVCWTLRRAGKPYVLTLHGGALPEFARDHPERVGRLLRSASAVTAPSRYLLEQMQSYCGQMQLIPNARDLASFPFRLRGAPQPRLVWVRRFRHDYNPSLAPRVMERLIPEFPDARLVMVGPDSGDGSREQMLETARRCGVADHIECPGAADSGQVAGWLNRSDLFLNTTSVDNTPLSVLEAMACGLPVVSTNVGGLPYLLDDGRNALLTPPDDAEAMAAAVCRVLREPGLAADLSRRARKTVEAYDWSVVLPQWERLLTTVLTGKRP